MFDEPAAGQREILEVIALGGCSESKRTKLALYTGRAVVELR